jgi:hypothetical protein
MSQTTELRSPVCARILGHLVFALRVPGWTTRTSALGQQQPSVSLTLDRQLAARSSRLAMCQSDSYRTALAEWEPQGLFDAAMPNLDARRNAGDGIEKYGSFAS